MNAPSHPVMSVATITQLQVVQTVSSIGVMQLGW